VTNALLNHPRHYFSTGTRSEMEMDTMPLVV
jgi:hypothetical protein